MVISKFKITWWLYIWYCQIHLTMIICYPCELVGNVDNSLLLNINSKVMIMSDYCLLFLFFLLFLKKINVEYNNPIIKTLWYWSCWFLIYWSELKKVQIFQVLTTTIFFNKLICEFTLSQWENWILFIQIFAF